MHLTELLIGVLLSSLVVKVAYTGITKLNRIQIKNTERSKQEVDYQQFQSFLRARFGGTKNFQSLSFRVPSSSGDIKQSMFAGFHVAPDTDILGNASLGTHKSDLLSFLVKVPLRKSLRLAADASGKPSSLVIQTTDGTSFPSADFTDGDFLVLSNTRYSESFQISGFNGSATVSGNKATVVLSSSWWKGNFSPTPSTPGLMHNYRVGDPVYIGRVVQVGYRPSTKCLEMAERGKTLVRSCGTAAFQVMYERSQEDRCLGMVPVLGENDFERLNWDLINESEYEGYSCVSRIKMSFQVSTKKMELTFKVNN